MLPMEKLFLGGPDTLFCGTLFCGCTEIHTCMYTDTSHAHAYCVLPARACVRACVRVCCAFVLAQYGCTRTGIYTPEPPDRRAREEGAEGWGGFKV